MRFQRERSIKQDRTKSKLLPQVNADAHERKFSACIKFVVRTIISLLVNMQEQIGSV